MNSMNCNSRQNTKKKNLSLFIKQLIYTSKKFKTCQTDIFLLITSLFNRKTNCINGK